MRWRKLNRILHRDLGYIFFGMTIIYAVSGIVLNHRSPRGDASIIARSESFQGHKIQKEDLNISYINDLFKTLELDRSSYKSFYFPSPSRAMIYIKNGHIDLNLETGAGRLTRIKKRPVLTEFNFLHYNKPKRLWTIFSDIYAGSLILIAITGLFIIRGRKGITGRGAILTGFGILLPLLFLIIYLWS